MKVTKCHYAARVAAAFSLLAILPMTAHAAGFTDWISGLKEFAQGLGGLFVVVAFLVGIIGAFFVIMNIIKIAKGDRDEGVVKAIISWLIVAALGLGFGGYMTATQETVTGSSGGQPSSIDKSQFGL